MERFKVLILGGGAGGLSAAAKIKKNINESSIAIVEPSSKHYYQPMWTLAGAGLVNKEVSQKNEKDFIPQGVHWIQDKVIAIDPDKQTVLLSNDKVIGYDYLIVATGLVLNWEKIEGLQQTLGQNGVCSIYQYDQVDYVAEQIKNFKGGNAIFVMPPPPIKCAGAPQKIMYLTDSLFRERGIRDQAQIIFATAGKAMFGIPTFSKPLEQIVKDRDIHPHFSHKLIAVHGTKREALFDVTDSNGQVSQKTLNFELLHVVPPMSAHKFISDSPLAFHEGDQKGWLAVDKETLQHLKYPNIFGLGDVTGVPNSKTGAAVRKQYPVVVKNLLAVMNGQTPEAKYDGYSSCPLITEVGKVMLAEFGYDGKILPSFPLDPSIPRKSYWHLKKDLLPILYWHGMLKGRA